MFEAFSPGPLKGGGPLIAAVPSQIARWEFGAR
jgi:hypothetical protein